jgi:hypothetical protein
MEFKKMRAQSQDFSILLDVQDIPLEHHLYIYPYI